MNTLFSRRSYDWWQLGLLKLAVLLIGIAIGATWQDVFAPHIVAIAVIGVAVGLYCAFAWFRSSRTSKTSSDPGSASSPL